MAYSNIDNLNLGSLLQIIFSNGVRNQISTDFRDFELIKRAKVGNSLAREIRFQFQSTLGASAIQYANPGTTNRAFPRAQQVDIGEKTAKFKELNATLELEYNLWSRAKKSPEKYADPLAIEVSSKASAAKRRLAADLYGDGTGVVGQLGTDAAAVTSTNSDSLWFTLDEGNTARGHLGFFEYGDILILRDPDTTTTALDTNLATEPVFWKVVERDFDGRRALLQGLDSAYAPVATMTAVSVQPASGAVFYRSGQPTIPNLSTIGSSDYGTLTEVIAGLETLTASDARVVHGITMQGASAGSRQSCSGAAIDVKYLQKCMDNMKRKVGKDRYKWKMMNMAPETHASFIESRETDRRFQMVDDNKRGVKFFAYIHENDTLECNSSEYVPPKRLYIMPEEKNGEKVIEFHGSDYEAVRAKDGDEWMLKPGADGGHVNMMVSYLQAVGVLICKHPAAVGVVTDFVNT